MQASTRIAPRGFTLIELLIVVAIIALISAVALPTILPALNERRVSESARVLQAILAGTRDTAIRANAPRGIRLLPDPVFNGQGGNPLASNRVIPIEPGPDYTEGLVRVPTPFLPNSGGTIDPTYLYAANYLSIAESGYYQTSGVLIPNNPTNWYQNIRQGDKVRFNDSGPYYTIAGPVNGLPAASNPERFIIGANSTVPLAVNNGIIQTGWIPDVLFLTNGQDDNGNGWVDESCDGIDNDGDGIVDPGFNGIDDDGVNGIDDPQELYIGINLGSGRYSGTEYEKEVFIGAQASIPPDNEAYTIFRRPVVSPGAREVTLPAGVVIDMTTWNAPAASLKPTSLTSPVLLPERSRLPVDSRTGYVDVMIDQTGRVIPPGAGMDGGGVYGNSPLSNLPFYHFWLTEREGVVAPLFGVDANFVPIRNPGYGQPGLAENYMLPMPKGTTHYSNIAALSGERRLITLFVKTGQITSNTIQLFNGYDTNDPFYDAQSGIKEPQ